ncbi:MAG: hypothetical protein ACTS9Y_04595 [Methylophilus sp.]|uniref:hypothetical protein n=1 Tax=Methylophilus sp. TaxID=29541 RepID=UPI003FA1712A
MNWILDLLTWENILNSAFTTSLVGALAGAYAGAKAAQNIAERSKEKEEFQTQIRNTNAAITFSFMICNAAISLKKQNTKHLIDSYFQAKSVYEEYLLTKKNGTTAKEVVFEYQANLSSLPVQEVPLIALQKQVYENLSITGRPLALVSTITAMQSALNTAIVKRNEMIPEFQKLSLEDRKGAFLALYFATPYGEGHTNAQYHDLMQAIHRLNDDVIFFSRLLSKDLETYGNAIMEKYKSKFGDVIERIHPARHEDMPGIIPLDENYQDWFTAFPQQ